MTVRIINADVMDGLAQLDSESVHCVVTSPPYFGLRDYGTAQWEGGDQNCEHRRFNGYPSGVAGTTEAQNKGKLFKEKCGICGAIRIDKQIGLEPTPDAYVAKLVEVFREVRRVLRKDGTCWLNLGDSYASGGNYCGINSEATLSAKQRSNGGARGVSQLLSAKNTHGKKPKDLIGIPWLVAFALQADGWWLRQDIIWSKPNPMPESVTDRCTKAHEYIFLLTKAERYFYDAEAIAEITAKPKYIGREQASWGKKKALGRAMGRSPSGNEATDAAYGGQETRNKRSVWEVATQPFPEAHFATFPPALIEPCFKAGCPEGGTVLDPFGGSGTAGLVADRLKRNAILIELNPEYAAMAERRVRGDCPMFAEVASA